MQKEPGVWLVGTSLAALLALGLAAGPASAFIIDFQTDDAGNALLPGQDLINPPPAGGEFFLNFTLSSGGSNAGAALYDATPHGGVDPDLEVGAVHGNVLMLQSNANPLKTGDIFNVPNDSAAGGWIQFDFLQVFEMETLLVIDVNGGGAMDILMTDSGGDTRKIEVPQFWTGEIGQPPATPAPGLGTIDLFNAVGQLSPNPNHPALWTTVTDTGPFDIADVVSLRVDFDGSGAIDDLKFIPEPATILLMGVGLVGLLRRRSG